MFVINMKKHFLALFVLLMIIFLSCFVFAQNSTPERQFIGSVNITVEQPTETLLAICASREKYLMEAGETRLIQLYVRNAMKNKSVEKVELFIPAVEGISFTYTPEFMENLEPAGNDNDVKRFDIYATADKDLPVGNYHIEFQLGTEEYLVGAFTDEVMIKIRPYSDELYYIYGAIIIIIALLFISRFVWIFYVNRKAKLAHQKKKKSKGKPISQYYYKTKKKNINAKKKVKK